MVAILEILGFAVLLAPVFALGRAAGARPDDTGLRLAARIAWIAWIVFVLWRVVDLAYLTENWRSVGQTVLIIGVIAVIVLGYRALLGRIRARADR